MPGKQVELASEFVASVEEAKRKKGKKPMSVQALKRKVDEVLNPPEEQNHCLKALETLARLEDLDPENKQLIVLIAGCGSGRVKIVPPKTVNLHVCTVNLV